MDRNYIRLLAIVLVSFAFLSFSAGGKADDSFGTRHSLKLVVDVTASGLGSLLQNETSRQKQIQIVAKYIKPIRFFPDSSGYFFVYDTNGICVAHATQPELVNKDLSGLRDARGVYVIQKFIGIAKNGGGFLEYSWQKPPTGQANEKLGYVSLIPGTELFIGSGIYFSSLQ